jgi:hypothetical protein
VGLLVGGVAISKRETAERVILNHQTSVIAARSAVSRFLEGDHRMK